jgi:transposase
MTRRRIAPLRSLTDEEREVLTELSRATSEPAAHVARAKALLAVADGKTYQEAAGVAGRRAGDAVAHLVARFNQEGLQAIAPRHGGGPTTIYGPTQRALIIQEARRRPDREQDGTATWSLTTLQKALRQKPEPDGLPDISTYTIWTVLREAGFSWQASKTWCETGTVRRKRKSGVVQVTDPDTEAKKTD